MKTFYYYFTDVLSQKRNYYITYYIHIMNIVVCSAQSHRISQTLNIKHWFMTNNILNQHSRIEQTPKIRQYDKAWIKNRIYLPYFWARKFLTTPWFIIYVILLYKYKPPYLQRLDRYQSYLNVKCSLQIVSSYRAFKNTSLICYLLTTKLSLKPLLEPMLLSKAGCNLFIIHFQLSANFITASKFFYFRMIFHRLICPQHSPWQSWQYLVMHLKSEYLLLCQWYVHCGSSLQGRCSSWELLICKSTPPSL